MNECERFPEGTRQRAICDGTADLPLYKINTYREQWGLGPILGPRAFPSREPKEPNANGRKPRPKQKAAGPKAKGRKCGGCGGSSKPRVARPNGWGPGSQLLKEFEAAGVPHCDECVELAGRMDRWGKRGCKTHLDKIVAEILPRAQLWMSENQPFLHKLLSLSHLEDTALQVAIRLKVQKAINSTEDRPVHRASRRRSSVHRAEDVSNLLESTLIRPAVRIEGTHHSVEKLSLGFEPTRHLLYHIYPRRNDIWKWNVDLLLPHLPLFNGRRIVAIAVDDTTVDAEEVKDAFGGGVVEFMVFRNNKKAAEMVSFLPLLAQVQTDDPDAITFRAHAKGTGRLEKDHRQHLREWIELLYTVNLANWDQVRQDLEEAAMTGACRKFDQFRKRPPLGKPSYSGSFYWFRNCYVYSRKWWDVENPRWGCESWPSLMFTKQETRCLLIDDTKSMYDPQYWEKTVRPQYRRWQEERGIGSA